MLERRSAITDVAIFFAIFLPLTAFAQWLLIGFEASARPAIGFIMWTVGLAALAAAYLRHIPLTEFGWQWGPWRYHFIAVALPLAYCLVCYFGASLLGFVEFASREKLASFSAALGFEELSLGWGFLMAAFLVIAGGIWTSMVRALGEEIGWRGFLTPRVNAAFGFVAGTFLTGLVWSVWHLPALFAGPYNGGGNAIYEAGSFVIFVIAASGIYAWLRMASGSFWPAVTLHGAHNLIVQRLFDPLVTSADGITVVGEFGVLFAAVVVLFSVPFWIWGQRLWLKSKA